MTGQRSARLGRRAGLGVVSGPESSSAASRPNAEAISVMAFAMRSMLALIASSCFRASLVRFIVSSSDRRMANDPNGSRSSWISRRRSLGSGWANAAIILEPRTLRGVCVVACHLPRAIWRKIVLDGSRVGTARPYVRLQGGFVPKLVLSRRFPFPRGLPSPRRPIRARRRRPYPA